MKILLPIWFILICLAYGQSTENFEYVNPLPGCKYVSPETNIIIKPGGIIDKASIGENLISVSGSKSGIHSGKLLLSNDSRTLVYNPDSKFTPYEKVTVELKRGIKTIDGKDAVQLNFSFFINRKSDSDDIERINNIQAESIQDRFNGKAEIIPNQTAGIPALEIDTSDNPSPGYIFIAPSPYLIIADNEGTPVFYRNVRGSIYDFKLQPNGELTYFIYPVSCYGLDSSLNVVRQFNTGNGYSVDVHDLRVLPNGNYFIIGKKLVDVDMSKIVEGGDSTAEIIDMALQEIDTSGNVVFQWSALDHYKITDADDYISLIQHEIDFVHLNSIEIDTDGNIMLSARNLDEITKIDRNTGDIIWRLGGENNQFTFINDNRGFSRQHDIRRISNGDITIFDNGVYHTDQYSSMVEYCLDEENKTATLVNRYSRNKLFSRTRGDIQELPNGNKLISWGEINNPALTEIKPDNSVAYELSLGSSYMKFHSYRFIWQTNLFKTGFDSLDFGKIDSKDSVEKEIQVYNEHSDTVIINEFHYKDSSFSVLNKLPFSIPGNDSAAIIVKFKPLNNGIFKDNLNIRFADNNQLIARQIYMEGSTINLINPITAPSDLKAFALINEVKLTWKDESGNESGFVIERKNGDSLSTNKFVIIDTVSADDTLFLDNAVKDSVEYTYRIYAFNNDTTSEFSNYAVTGIITSAENFNNITYYYLFQNYPNPFNPSTNINYQIPKAGLVKLTIYNIIGQKVKTLVNKFQNKGSYSIRFDGSNLPSGIYFCRLKANQFTSIKKLTLIK